MTLHSNHEVVARRFKLLRYVNVSITIIYYQVLVLFTTDLPLLLVLILNHFLHYLLILHF